MTTAHFTDAERRITIAGVMIVFLLSALDQTIVSTAMPVIISQLHGLELYSLRTLSASAQAHAAAIDLPQPIRVFIADSVTHVILLSTLVVAIAIVAALMIPELPLRERPQAPPKGAMSADTQQAVAK